MTLDNFAKTGYDSFEAMYESEYQRVLAMIIPRVRDRNIAEDLTQDTFSKVIKNIGTYTPEGGKIRKDCFKNWINTISLNTARDYLRRMKTERSFLNGVASKALEPTTKADFPLAGYKKAYEEEILSQREDSLNPEEQAIQQQGLEKVMRSLEGIDNPKSRAVALLRIVRELRYREVSEELGIPLGTVVTRFNRARAQLKEMWEDE